MLTKYLPQRQWPLWQLMVLAVIAVQIVAAIQGVITAQNIPTWYASLHKPSFTPPNWLFAPVWTTLYTIIGLVWGTLVYKKQQGIAAASKTLWLYHLHLLANFSWTFIFFGAHLIGVALLNILLLWVLIGLCIKAIYPISKPWALALLPYWGWVSFASSINASLWWLNH